MTDVGRSAGHEVIGQFRREGIEGIQGEGREVRRPGGRLSLPPGLPRSAPLPQVRMGARREGGQEGDQEEAWEKGGGREGGGKGPEQRLQSRQSDVSRAHA